MKYLDYYNGFSDNANTPIVTVFENKCRQNPRVSIAIPTFNRVATLEEAVESALSQQFDDYDIIVIDNNPERGDHTEIFMQRYRNNSKVSYYKNADNIGLYGNWNRCIEMARGEWVTLLHDDDYYFSTYLSTIFDYIDHYPYIQGLYCNHLNWKSSENGDQISVINHLKLSNGGITKVKDYMLFVTHDVGPVGIVLKRQNALTLGGYNAGLYPISDYAFNWRYHKCFGLYYLDKTLVHYRVGINVSIKPDTIERQEERCLEIRREYAEGKKFERLLNGLSYNTYNNNLAGAQQLYPNFEWGHLASFRFNLYHCVWRFLLLWNQLYIRLAGRRLK